MHMATAGLTHVVEDTAGVDRGAVYIHVVHYDD